MIGTSGAGETRIGIETGTAIGTEAATVAKDTGVQRPIEIGIVTVIATGTVTEIATEIVIAIATGTEIATEIAEIVIDVDVTRSMMVVVRHPLATFSIIVALHRPKDMVAILVIGMDPLRFLLLIMDPAMAHGMDPVQGKNHGTVNAVHLLRATDRGMDQETTRGGMGIVTTAA